MRVPHLFMVVAYFLIDDMHGVEFVMFRRPLLSRLRATHAHKHSSSCDTHTQTLLFMVVARISIDEMQGAH